MTDIYHIRVTLRDTRPPIWRRVAVPADISLGQLHEVIQIAMGWTDSHLHQFILEDKSLRRGPETIARLTDEGEPESGVEYPVCLTGRRACPPEDCGGVFGYEHLLEVAADPEHEDREEMEEWIDQEWKPAAFDLDEVNAALAEWRRAQKGSKRRLP